MFFLVCGWVSTGHKARLELARDYTMKQHLTACCKTPIVKASESLCDTLGYRDTQLIYSNGFKMIQVLQWKHSKYIAIHYI